MLTKTNTAIGITAVALLVGSTLAATAGARDRYNPDRAYGDVQAERERQRMLVENGRNDGSLTWYEKLTINREQARIDQLEREAIADGRLSRDEYRMIRQAQDDAARHIHAERHDAQVRGWWWRMWR